MSIDITLLEDIWDKAKIHRPTVRGFRPITIDFLKIIDNPQTVLEFGISGGGSHEKWKNAGATVVGGVELFHPDHKDKWSKSTYNECMRSWNFLQDDIIPYDQNNVYRFVHGISSYDSDAPNQFELKQWDLIVDDGFNGCHGQEQMLPVWKDFLNPDGIMITYTPNGYGCDEQRQQSWSDNFNAFEDLGHQGWVIFDCTPWVDWEHPGYASVAQGRWMGVYTPNMDKYRDIYLKYERHVVAGGAFLE